MLVSSCSKLIPYGYPQCSFFGDFEILDFKIWKPQISKSKISNRKLQDWPKAITVGSHNSSLPATTSMCTFQLLNLSVRRRENVPTLFAKWLSRHLIYTLEIVLSDWTLPEPHICYTRMHRSNCRDHKKHCTICKVQGKYWQKGNMIRDHSLIFP